MDDSLSLKLYSDWMKFNPSLTEEVMKQDICDIEPNFMCFANVYDCLSKIIPIHWTVLDLGCAYAPQCYYFRNHKKYIGVDIGDVKRFYTPNAEMHQCSIKDFFKNQNIVQSLDFRQTFGIISYVPAKPYDYFLAKNFLENIFVYYPYEDQIKLKIGTDEK